jgi:two-component system, sensor histidine kinase
MVINGLKTGRLLQSQKLRHRSITNDLKVIPLETRAFSPPPVSRGWMKVSELLRSEISSVSGLEDEVMLAFGKAQIGSIRANLPLLFVINLAGLLTVGYFLPNKASLGLFGAFTLLALLAVVFGLPRVKDITHPAAMRGILRRTEFSALLIGLCWAGLPAYSLSLSDAASSNIWVPVLVMISSLLAYCLASVPSAALLLLGLMVSALTLPALRSPDWTSVVLLVTCLCHFAVFAALIIARYRCLLDLAQNEENCRRQTEIISLLLKDFESGSKDWLWETDSKGQLVYLTDRLAELTGQPFEQLLGKRLSDISGLPSHIGPWQSFHNMIDEHRDVGEIEVPVKLANERRWWQITARPVFAANRDFLGYRGVGRDVTEVHRAQAALVQAKEMAERASDAKSQFLNVMSHELRTPLNAIIGFSEIMAEEREGPLGTRSYSDYSRSIVESSRQLQRTINDILDASRIDHGTFKLLEQEVDAAELAQVAVRNCRQLTAQTNVTLTADYRSIRAEIRGDLVRLKQILDNLLTNAIKFTPALGTVELTVREELDGGLSFIIRDTGIGIEKKDLELVFQPFVQADVGMNRQFGGTGLGLPIARKLARAHGGEITLESSPGEGTTATFHLPVDRVIRNGAPHSIAHNVAAA